MYSYTTIIYLRQQELNTESTKTFSPVIPLCLWPLLNKAAWLVSTLFFGGFAIERLPPPVPHKTLAAEYLVKWFSGLSNGKNFENAYYKINSMLWLTFQTMAFMAIQDSVHWMKDKLPVKTKIITFLRAAPCYISQEQPILSSNTMIIWVYTYINCSVEDRRDNSKSGTEVGGGLQTATFLDTLISDHWHCTYLSDYSVFCHLSTLFPQLIC